MSRMPHERQRQGDGCADHRHDDRREPEVAVAAPGQHQHDHDGGSHQQHAAEPVDLAPAVKHRDLAHLRQQQCQRAERERHVDPEDHRPVHVLGEHAAEDRPADAADHPYAAEIGLILAALARAHHVGNHGLHDRHDAAAAEPLQAARQNQHRHARRQRAQHRARDEQAEGYDDHGAAAVDVAERAEHRRHRGRCQQIGRDHPGQAGDVVELAADGRQRCRDDGLVECRQKHGQQQAHQDGADFAWGQRHLRRDRRRIAEFDDLSRQRPGIARSGRRQCLLLSRVIALPFEFVHTKYVLRVAQREARMNHYR